MIIYMARMVMKPIKKIAGEVLLFFYAKQRKGGFESLDIIHFTDWKDIKMPGDNDITKGLKAISASAADIYNALEYLEDSGYLSYRRSRNTGGDMMHQFRVTAGGIDIVEGIERDEEAKHNFTVNFNIKLADSVTVESLIKNELGSLIKTSLI